MVFRNDVNDDPVADSRKILAPFSLESEFTGNFTRHFTLFSIYFVTFLMFNRYPPDSEILGTETFKMFLEK